MSRQPHVSPEDIPKENEVKYAVSSSDTVLYKELFEDCSESFEFTNHDFL